MHKNTTRLTYHRTIRLPVTFLLATLIGFGVLSPQVAAQLGCLHACCISPAESHMQHDHVRITGPSHSSCCVMESSDDCQWCRFDEIPVVELACHPLQNQHYPSSSSVSADQRDPLPNAASQVTRALRASASERGSPPLYLQTLTLLI